MLKVISTIALAALLASCASGPPRTPREMIDRVLANSPNNASPGKVVAAEIALSGMAREEGQWTALRAFMAPDALLHDRDGPVAAGPWLAARRDPAGAVPRGPRAVWMSCDGHLAVSRGRLLFPDGSEGSFATVWRRQQDAQYRWIYDLEAPDALPDDQQPAGEDGLIVVVAEEMIQGYVADCPSASKPLAPWPGHAGADTTPNGGEASPDGTLRWRWEQRGDGVRRFVADYFAEGVWKTVVSEQFAAAAAD